jgi:hypothetical protein
MQYPGGSKPQNWLTEDRFIGRHPVGESELFSLGGGYESAQDTGVRCVSQQGQSRQIFTSLDV